MADSKKYDGSQWKHSLRKLTTATEAVENPLYSDGAAITSYTIKGNTVQNGTPTPSNPVDVNGVGVRTENLFDISSAVRYEYVITNVYADTITDGTISAYVNANCYVIKASPSATYTLKVHTSNDVPVLRAGFYNLPVPSKEDRIVHDGTQARSYTSNPTITITNSGNYPYLILQVSSAYVSYLTITVGSTPPASFIPYGYKIPISNGQQTTNIYLGSTQTTRKIKKYEFTGQENIQSTAESLSEQGTFAFAYNFTALNMTDILDYNELISSIPYPQFVSTHFKLKNEDRDSWKKIKNAECGANGNGNNIFLILASNQYTTTSDFKSYLAQQYANGTPVTIWYALATPETGIVNEPLQKIGDYADTINNAAQIPTIEGTNVITVDTTVQPSEFTATWAGWHDARVKEKSENLWNEEYIGISSGSGVTYLPIYVGSGNFTLSTTTRKTESSIQSQNGNANIFFLTGNVSSGAYTSGNGVWNEQNRTVTATDGYVTIAYRYLEGDSGSDPRNNNTMLNTGSTALPYELYWK